nr:SRPBCC domain-containing protein [Geothrix sp. SG198]
MVDIIHRVGIKASPEKVYSALTTLEGLAHWWTEDTEGNAALGGAITFSFRSPAGDLIGKMAMTVQELKAPDEVRWLCTEGPSDWLGTLITFQLSRQDNQTIVLFGHRNWAESTEFMAHCSMKWATFLLSLRAYAEAGAGKPSPGDLKIDNWN